MPKINRILCYGDSLTAGFHSRGKYFEPYGESLEEKLGEKKFKVDFCGRCGATTEDMLRDLNNNNIQDRFRPSWKGKGLKKILDENQDYDLVILLLGTNDLACGIPPEQICKNLMALHNIVLLSSPHIKSIALGVPDGEFLHQSNELTNRWISVNTFLEKEAENIDRLMYVPFPFELDSQDLYDDGKFKSGVESSFEGFSRYLLKISVNKT